MGLEHHHQGPVGEVQLHGLDGRAGLLVGGAEALVGRGAGDQGLLVQAPRDAAEPGRHLGQLFRRDQAELEQQGGRAHDVVDVVQAEQLGGELQPLAPGGAQAEPRSLADADVLGEIAGARLQPVPDDFAALRQAVKGRMVLGAD